MEDLISNASTSLLSSVEEIGWTNSTRPHFTTSIRQISNTASGFPFGNFVPVIVVACVLWLLVYLALIVHRVLIDQGTIREKPLESHTQTEEDERSCVAFV